MGLWDLHCELGAGVVAGIYYTQGTTTEHGTGKVTETEGAVPD